MIETSDPSEITIFENPAVMAGLVDPAMLSGQVKFYPWQLRIHRDFAVPSSANKPYRGVVRAANGSGKDKVCVSPCVVWLGTRYANCNSIVTSSSGSQLDRISDTYIRQLCEGINRKFGEEIWKCNYREYTNLRTKSVINLFATDEPGKAEGVHPIVHDGQMGVFISEAKSIPENMFEAFSRFSGFTKRLDVSSPGVAFGHFYDVCTNKELGWTEYHVTAYDCPHLTEDHIRQIKLRYRENSVHFKSVILAEFGVSEGELLVISPDKLTELFRYVDKIEHISEKHNTGGLDLSAGSDETVLIVRNGNKVITLEAFHITDTSKMVRHLESLFRKYELTTINSPILADAGGLGKPIIDQFRDRGWRNVQYVMNQWEPRDRIAYGNLGTENWFKLQRIVEELEVIIPNDETLRKQLSNRYYKIRPDNSFVLESKIQARAKGRSSPDRGDALALVFSNYQPSYLQKEHRQTQDVPVHLIPTVPDLTLREFVTNQDAKNLYRGMIRQPTALEMNRLVAETNVINNRIKNYFVVKKLLDEKVGTNETNN